jgi:SAM-dependent methyltransferase
MDVIEHQDDDVAAVREYRRVVEPGGTIIVVVPGYQWAWSVDDKVLGHHRRYTARELEALLRRGGLVVERSEHFHSWLVPISVLLGRIPRFVGGDTSPDQASRVHPLLNRFLLAVSRAERRLARLVHIPVGLSIMVVARAREEPPV